MKRCTFLCLMFLLGSCKSEYSNRQLAGKWQAISLTEDTVPLAVDLTQIWMEFTEKGTYTFHSTLNIKEEGIYRLERKNLVRRNTLDPNASEKAVELMSVSKDSMRIGMREGEKVRCLIMKRSS